MAARITVAFVFSIVGAIYQLISPGLASLFDPRTSLLFYIGSTNAVLNGLVIFWGASHLLEDWKGRITWPSIILAVAITNLSSIIIAFLTPSGSGILLYFYASPSFGALLVMLPGPLLVLVGGIVGFAAV